VSVPSLGATARGGAARCRETERMHAWEKGCMRVCVGGGGV
jgi:hypothetical protein